MLHLKKLQNKIFHSESKLKKQIDDWKSNGDTIVFTNGCFDLMHPGHVEYLAKAADFGQRLIIGVNTDSSVSALKGEHRPIQNEQSRLFILAALESTDAVILFDEPTPLRLIELINPNVLAKGGDYTIETIVGSEFVLNNGGSVQVIPFKNGFSTSAIEQKIIKANKSQ